MRASRYLAGLSAVVLGVLLPAAGALAGPPGRIVNGTVASDGAYPAQGYLLIDDEPDPGYDHACAGTLVGSRQFLTAAHCATEADLDFDLPPSAFLVRLGSIDRSPPAGEVDEYTVAANDVQDLYAPSTTGTLSNDVAMLTLSRPAPYDVTRVVDDDVDDDLWAPGKVARVIGWGQISTNGPSSELLREADVPIIDDERCAGAYGGSFDESTMVCAADPPETPATAAHGVCFGDSGGPLLVLDGAAFALAGVVSWGGTPCADPARPGVYTRVGDGALNQWVHDRTPEADFDLDHVPKVNEPVTLFSTSRYPPRGPAGDAFFDTFNWDLDNDGAFDDASGSRITTTYPTAGEQVVGLEASNAAAGDKASVYYAFDVAPEPPPPPPPPPPPTTTPAATLPQGPLATILVSGRPKVRRGRFNIRVNFAQNAPAGIAVVEVFRGRRVIGIGRTRVRRGGSKRVSVKLTPTGRRQLRRSASKRLRVKVRVRVKRRTLRSKRITIRR